jgi:hypothetical protein
MRHFVATKKLSKKPRWETPSGFKVSQETRKTFHAKSQSSLRKEDKKVSPSGIDGARLTDCFFLRGSPNVFLIVG